MLFFLTSILSLTAIAADFIHFRRRRRRKLPVRRALVAWVAATDALPILSSLIGALSRDNGPELMHLYMWLFWAWIVTVPPRLAFYAFNFVNLRRTGYVAACAFVLFTLWGTTRGRTSIRVNRVEICSDRIPEAFDGFRFVQITDMHVGTLVRPERELTRLADSVNAQRPEAVFFTGDLVNIRAGELDERTTALLRRIAGPVWSVTGNHDVGTYIKDSLRFPAAGEAREVVARQRAMGWTVLEDTTVYLRRGADSISLTGLSFDPALRERRHDRDLPGTAIPKAYAGVPDSLYNIALVHIPQLWEQIVEAGYGDLTLSGHVHSMQLKIRPWGRGWSPAKWIYKHWSGRYDTGRHTLYVNDGTMQITLSFATTADGYLDDNSPRRLMISTPEDWEAVLRLRASHDAILAGAETLRRDDPALLLRDAAARELRRARGMRPDLTKVTLTHSGRLSPSMRFFTEGDADRYVFSEKELPELKGVAEVISSDGSITASAIVTELEKRGVERLLVEGGASVLRMFLAEGMADTVRRAVNPQLTLGPERGGAQFRFEVPEGAACRRENLGGMEVATCTLRPDTRDEDLRYLAQAVAEGLRCVPSRTSYCVGAVVALPDGRSFTGYTHETSPTHHAEQEAIRKALDAGAELRGAAIYSSMEPCSQRKSEPESCTQLILRHGFARVVFALYEPDRFVRCRGAQTLREAGVDVRVYPELAEGVRRANAHLGR